MHRGFYAVTDEPLLAQAGEEEIFYDVALGAFADLNGPFFDEAPAFQGIHGVAGEVSGVSALHLQGKLTRTEAGA